MDRHLACSGQSRLLYYTFRAFDQTGQVRHAFSTRVGGISRGSFSSLNLSVLTTDELKHVLENRRRFFRAIAIPQDNIVSAHQVHGSNIYRVCAKDRGAGAFEPKTAIPLTDALMTDEAGIALTAFFADCFPIYFLDPVQRAVAIAHAGWKGTVAKIAAKTALAMQKIYRSNLGDMLVGIGPGIGQCHYQVDKPVITAVKSAFPAYYSELLASLTEDEAYAYFDLSEANFRQLQEIGIPAANISRAKLCTSCHEDVFFSHRRGMGGRQAAVIMLN